MAATPLARASLQAPRLTVFPSARAARSPQATQTSAIHPHPWRGTPMGSTSLVGDAEVRLLSEFPIERTS